MMGVKEVTSGQTQTEPQSLPTGWARATIGDILTLEYGKSLVKADRAESGEYPVYGSSGIVGFHTEHLIKQPAIIVGRKGAAGAVHLCKKDFWPIDTTYFVKVNNSLSTDFIYYLLKFCRLQKYESSTAIPGLNRDHAYGEKISLPPLAEQQRIVAKIEELFSELDKGVENLHTAQQQLKVYRQALLKHAFEGKLTADWRAQNPHKLESADAQLARIQQEREARYQQQLQDWEANGKTGSKPKAPKALPPLTAEELLGLPKLPNGWTWFKVHQLCDVVRGGSPRPAGDPKFYGGSIPFLKVADITGNNSPYLKNFTYTITEAGLSKTRQIEPKTLLLSNSGATLGVPKICLITATMNDGVAAFLGLPHDDLLYHYYFWQSKTESLRNIDQGAAQPNLNTDIIKETVIPICSQAEQLIVTQKIESVLSDIDQLEQTITHSLQQAEALRQSILKKAFSGQLVAQDANDEPASVLLERIKEEKQAKPAAGKRMPRTAPAALPSNVVPMPAHIPGIASTDLHAGILALAYSAHEAEPKYLPYFGHVKGEKVSHLVEAHLGIELDRAPVKDAAGPIDYPHLKKVESRARKVGWFDMRREPGATAYSLHKLAGFNELQVKTRQALGPRLGEVEALLRLLLPLNTRQAEIVATLYAAWNNLLLAGLQPSDPQIIFEARDNWHPDKLKIEQERFEKGLSWIKAKGLVPSGQGRPVKSKPA